MIAQQGWLGCCCADAGGGAGDGLGLGDPAAAPAELEAQLDWVALYRSVEEYQGGEPAATVRKGTRMVPVSQTDGLPQGLAKVWIYEGTPTYQQQGGQYVAAGPLATSQQFYTPARNLRPAAAPPATKPSGGLGWLIGLAAGIAVLGGGDG